MKSSASLVEAESRLLVIQYFYHHGSLSTFYIYLGVVWSFLPSLVTKQTSGNFVFQKPFPFRSTGSEFFI